MVHFDWDYNPQEAGQSFDRLAKKLREYLFISKVKQLTSIRAHLPFITLVIENLVVLKS